MLEHRFNEIEQLYQVGKPIGLYGFAVWFEFNPDGTEVGKEQAVEIPTSALTDVTEEKDNDFRSWLHLQGINDYLEAEPLENIDILHSNGLRITWELDKNGLPTKILKTLNGQTVYWAETKTVYNDNQNIIQYSNSRGVIVNKVFNQEKKSYFYNWLKGKPHIEYAKRRNYLA